VRDVNSASLIIHANRTVYSFHVIIGGKKIPLGSAQARYLSSEVAGGFTGVITGLYAVGDKVSNYAEFTDFRCEYL